MFTKLDRGILQSSIMAEDSDTFKIWVVLLAACDSDGIAPVSAVYISSVARLSLDVVRAAIVRLEAPDPESRSTNDEGRRLRRVDGGFELINYQVYRARSLREAEAERKRLYRLHHPPHSPSSGEDKKNEEGEGEASPPVRKCPDKDGTDKDGLLPIPKGLPFELRDPLVNERAEIRRLARMIEQGKRQDGPDRISPEGLERRRQGFNQRIKDVS